VRQRKGGEEPVAFINSYMYSDLAEDQELWIHVKCKYCTDHDYNVMGYFFIGKLTVPLGSRFYSEF